jgi:hypothetical protein
VNGTNQIVSDTADNDYGWNGPKQQNWQVRLLLIGCPQPENASRLPLVPDSNLHGKWRLSSRIADHLQSALFVP